MNIGGILNQLPAFVDLDSARMAHALVEKGDLGIGGVVIIRGEAHDFVDDLAVLPLAAGGHDDEIVVHFLADLFLDAGDDAPQMAVVGVFRLRLDGEGGFDDDGMAFDFADAGVDGIEARVERKLLLVDLFQKLLVGFVVIKGFVRFGVFDDDELVEAIKIAEAVKTLIRRHIHISKDIVATPRVRAKEKKQICLAKTLYWS